ncbi:hypothetical protein QE152_g40195 [Popillia japonica]|uniref:Uncharacterized protein n=1 Tax=Popillia japonica TaxID=7064 RepID=A0AAW1HSM7_POPJA
MFPNKNRINEVISTVYQHLTSTEYFLKKNVDFQVKEYWHNALEICNVLEAAKEIHSKIYTVVCTVENSLKPESPVEVPKNPIMATTN